MTNHQKEVSLQFNYEVWQVILNSACLWVDDVCNLLRSCKFFTSCVDAHGLTVLGMVCSEHYKNTRIFYMSFQAVERWNTTFFDDVIENPAKAINMFLKEAKVESAIELIDNFPQRLHQIINGLMMYGDVRLFNYCSRRELHQVINLVSSWYYEVPLHSMALFEYLDVWNRVILGTSQPNFGRLGHFIRSTIVLKSELFASFLFEKLIDPKTNTATAIFRAACLFFRRNIIEFYWITFDAIIWGNEKAILICKMAEATPYLD
jgi:hypothetical protein